MSLFKSEAIVTPNIQGVQDGSAAVAGNVGEVLSAILPVGSAVSLTTATPKNVLTISLTPGDWDVTASINYSATSATVAAGTSFSSGITKTTATVPVDGSEFNLLVPALTTTTFKTASNNQRKVFSVSAVTPVYLVANATFSAGTVAAYGTLVARRVR